MNARSPKGPLWVTGKVTGPEPASEKQVTEVTTQTTNVCPPWVAALESDVWSRRWAGPPVTSVTEAVANREARVEPYPALERGMLEVTGGVRTWFALTNAIGLEV